MQMRSWVIAVAVAAVGTLAPSRAFAQPAKDSGPTVEVRIQSVNVLLDKAEYVGGLLGQEDVVIQVKELIKTLETDGKGIEGIDPKKPFGAYGTLLVDVGDSPAVVMIPIADQQRFLLMLKDRLGVEAEKADNGTLKATLPLVNEAYFKFANGYLYAARDPKHLDAKNLLDPKTFFAKDDGSVASAVVHIDRIPADIKTFVIGQLEHQAQEALKNQNPDPFGQMLATFLLDEGVVGTKMVLDDGQKLTLKAFIDAKSGELSAEGVLTAKEGSPLAKVIAGLAGQSSRPAGIAAAKDTVAKGSVKANVTPDQKERLGKFVDEAIEALVKQAKPNEKELVKRILTTLAPTAKAGELDAAFAMTGPDAKGTHKLLVAAIVKDGKDIETLAKELSAFVPGDEAEFEFNVGKAGEFALHKVTLGRVDEKFEAVFGSRTIWLATSTDCYVVSIEADGAFLKSALTAKAVPVPVVSVEVALAKAVPLMQPNLKPDEVKALMRDAFGDGSPAGNDTLTVTVEGGKQLTAKAVLKGKALRLISAIEAFKVQ